MINVPTAVWIDERGRIVRQAPPDTMFPDDKFVAFHGLKSELYLDALRAWVKEGKAPDDGRGGGALPDAAEPRAAARACRVRGRVALQKKGQTAAAERHFVRAGELAPHELDDRRGLDADSRPRSDGARRSSSCGTREARPTTCRR
jgi:hypothetical protein